MTLPNDWLEERVTVSRGYLAQVHREAYNAGLRRAQELAKERAWGRMGADIDWSEFDQAIDAEAAKERT